ncbi:MAG TPA: response regulator [Nevskiales bacterium]|nr:response regulator [Nevskiales bacterium]
MTDQPARKPCVLFVDDEPRILNTMRILFRRSYDVLTATSGAEALALLRQHTVDVVVSDQRMPEMTGIELLRLVRDLQPNAMRVLLTGYSELNAIIGSINEGEIFRFVSKPWSNEELQDTLAKAVDAARVDYASLVAGARLGEVGDDAMAAEDAPGVLILDSDPGSRLSLQNMLKKDFPEVHTAGNVAECAQLLLEHPNIGVLVTEAYVQGKPVTSLLALLKQYQPQLVSVVVTDRADANNAIAMINHGQVYRFLLKPLREGMAKINVVSALRHHQVLSRNPELANRHRVEQLQPEPEQLGLLARLRQRVFSRPGA